MDKEINYQNGRLEIKKLFSNSDLFDFPKPIFLFEKIIKIFDWNVSDIILDFFSGSATTAHAVMQLNAEDNGNRKFIMVQIPEATDEKSEAYKANYKTIAEIGKERIRRAGEKIKEDNADKKGIDDLDVGFRVLKVDSSNMRDVYYTPDNTKQSGLLDFDNIKVGRSDEDLLFQVLLDWGVDLTLKIERKDIDGKSVYFVDDDTLAACFEKNIDEDFVKELAKTQPLRVVFRDSSFTGDDVKINVEQIFKHTSEHTDIKVI
jgi:adenine-specific DNA-methyltransferase